MKKMIVSLLTFAALALPVTAMAQTAETGLPPEIESRGSIVFATEGAWAPWTYHDEETDELVGFDVEVARAIAEKIGVEAEFVECPWESIFLGIDAKMYDMAANGVEITEERSEKYDFSVPYAYLRTALIVRGDNEEIQSFEDLEGKRTANSAGSTYAMLAESYGASTDTVSTLAQTLDLVLAGRVDATINAELSFYDYMKEHPEADLKIAALADDASQVGIPMRKGEDNASLYDAVNSAIEELRADGTLKEISEKYFDTDITAEP